MGFFYRYKCKNCGKKYTYLPVNCDCCGTELSFTCPMNRMFTFENSMKTVNCEEINELILPFGRKARVKELEQKIQQLCEEMRIKEFESQKAWSDNNDFVLSLQMEVSRLRNTNLRQKLLIDQYERDLQRNKIPDVSQDTISAVRYAMKHAHPDNGGSAEDFVRFKKCYEKLTGR